MNTEPRFTAMFEVNDITDVIPGMEDAETLKEAWNLLTDWVEENLPIIQLDWGYDGCDHGNVELETVSFELSVTDSRDDSEISESNYYIFPNEPEDADGEWEYRGCYDSVEYRVCGSIEGGKDWWWLEDCSELQARGGWADRTYTQDTSLIHEELVEDEDEDEEAPEYEEPRFLITVNGEEVDEDEVCRWEGIADLDDIDDADEMLDAVIAYIEQGHRGNEDGTRFDIVVESNDDDEDTADGWVEF